ncbi:MORN repeat variant [Maribacter sedimenticola]|uniref:MORN repeat variant n=1 Tax=Maribacter sedimenticola TaxID=228956 RepID=A0ABY1SM43_9FLAO|nr:toxin-antitoxin system YwqK family antitoxin [Maribacter sedimenticola]SNR79769.1 MORN repeat variant [Maribacter sedimenticola]
MKNLIFIISILLFIACKEEKKVKLAEGVVDCNDLFQNNEGTWFLNNQPYTGTCESYENGVIQSYSEFKDGLVNGKMKYFFPNGQVEEEVEWTNGLANGKVKYYHENGQVAELGQVENESKEGIWKVYYPNGQLKNLENWKNGQLQDSVYSYFENGNMHSKGIFVNGKEDGRWVMFDSISGDVDGYLYYENGEAIRAEKK